MGRLFLFLLLAAVFPVAASEKEGNIERLAAEVAGELARLCPAAAPGDQAAFDRCRQALFQDSAVRRALGPHVLWGRRNQNAGAALKETNLTQFAPDVLTGMYLPLFMFNGRHTVDYVEREGLWRVRLEAAFRNRLAPGEFPYPFWHNDEKWNVYQSASAVLLWIDPKTLRVKAGQFTERGGAPVVSSAPVAHAFDGKWVWTDSSGRTQPQVTLFDGLFRADNPYLRELDNTYRTLALRMRDGQCDTCHVPDNPHGMKRLVLLQTPAHAAGEIQRLMKAVRDDKMPLDDMGIEQPLEPKMKDALLQSGAAFEAALSGAKAWEAKRKSH
jgi:hypothetical protein